MDKFVSVLVNVQVKFKEITPSSIAPPPGSYGAKKVKSETSPRGHRGVYWSCLDEHFLMVNG